MTRGFALVLIAVLVTFSAQQVLTPILAPLSRELTLTETQLGLVITVAAAMLTVLSPVWGRAVDRIGNRVTLLLGLGLATAGLIGFAAAAQLGLTGAVSPGWTVTLFLITRSALFGGGLAAIPVVALALAAKTTEGDHARTRAVGLVGAAQGVSLVLGPAAGGALAASSLLLPIYVAPALLLALLVTLTFTLDRVGAAGRPAGPRVRVSPFDGRLLPVLVVGFVLFLSLSQVQVVLGFVVADRLGLDGKATAGAVGLALFVAGVVLVGMQAAVVPRLRWTPLRLLRAGIPLTVVAFAVLWVAGSLWSITLGVTVLAAGLGLALPGYTTAPTLLVGPREQGAVSGLVNANNGLTFVVGPLLGTALYEWSPVAPFVLALALCAAVLLFVFLSPAARDIGTRRAPALSQQTDGPQSVR